jgi:hypothetical protein
MSQYLSSHAALQNFAAKIYGDVCSLKPHVFIRVPGGKFFES